MKGIVYILNGQPITLWPCPMEVYDEEGNPTGEVTTNLDYLISTLPPGTEYELVTEEEAVSWLEAHKPPPTADEIRIQRNALLAETDYIMCVDYPINDEIKNAVVTYRQALRDISNQKEFPENVIWPIKPEGI